MSDDKGFFDKFDIKVTHVTGFGNGFDIGKLGKVGLLSPALPHPYGYDYDAI